MTYTVFLHLNQGGDQSGQAGIFAHSDQRLNRLPIEDLFLADLDADGDPDAVVGGKALASIWLNEGQAGFRAAPALHQAPRLGYGRLQ